MKKEYLLILILIFSQFVNADIISMNSGGDDNLIINPDSYIEGFFSGTECTPLTCAGLGYNCGTWSDGCDGTLNCGTCASGYTCSAGICTVIPVGPGGGGGGGGGGAVPTVKLTDLKVIPDNFNLAMNANMTSSAKMDLQNTGKSDLNIAISLTDSLKDIISFNQKTNFILTAGESKTLDFQIKAPSEAGIYTGKIIFNSKGKVLQIPFVLNVRSGISLFDISLYIPEESRVIKVGEKIKGQINLIQAGVKEPMDVSLHYIVKDFEDKVYLEESETIMVYNQKSYEHEFNTQNLLPGDYIIGGEVIYEGGVATASYPFKVIEEKIADMTLIYIGLLTVLTIAIIVMLLLIRYYKKQKQNYKKKKHKKRR